MEQMQQDITVTKTSQIPWHQLHLGQACFLSKDSDYFWDSACMFIVLQVSRAEKHAVPWHCALAEHPVPDGMGHAGRALAMGSLAHKQRDFKLHTIQKIRFSNDANRIYG